MTNNDEFKADDAPSWRWIRWLTCNWYEKDVEKLSWDRTVTKHHD